MAKIKAQNFLEDGKNPFLTPEREKIWDLLKKSEKTVSKDEVILKSKELRKKYGQ